LIDEYPITGFIMSTHLDLVLQKHPDHEVGIRLLASRDPSGNLKYLDWGAKILGSGQALAPEIADVLELFHTFSGRRYGKRRDQFVRSDIYTYRPQDLAHLRDSLLKIKRKRAVEAVIIYDSPDLIVRHIKNKEASVHYGHGTKWCISMLREGYFEDYEAQNATFFFFERKVLADDEFDKVALMIPRNGGEESATAFTSLDRSVDMMILAKVYGPHVFDIFREVHERSAQYPGSAMFRVYDGSATREQIESVYAGIAKMNSYETDGLLESICCNDAAPLPLLEEIVRRALALSLAAWKRSHRHSRRPMRRGNEIDCIVVAALSIHPAVPIDQRERIVKELRKRRVNIHGIHREKSEGRIGVSYHSSARRIGRIGHLRRGRRVLTLTQLQSRVRRLERMTAQAKKWVKKKVAEIKKKKATK